MFLPPRCPHRTCSSHRLPPPRFFARHGHYRAKCRPWPVPRYRCKSCRRTFSRQTFRADYRDHRPDLNVSLLRLLASGVGLRQSARNLHLSLRCTELKFRKLARHLRRLNLNLRGPLPSGAVLQLDELETYETRRNTRPLSVPTLIERESRFVLWAEAASIRPRGRMTKTRRALIRAETRRFGPRKDHSRRAVLRTLTRGAAVASELARVILESDEKASYRVMAEQAFGEARLEHRTTSSRLPRTTWNPLFPINHSEAMARDLLGRLRRESWLVSKKRRYLDLGLQVWMAYRNYVRRRFNRDRFSPAQMLGYVPRRMALGELVSWRQDWGRQSIHPLSRCAATIEELLRRSCRESA
jgi:transposase-like protein